MTSDAHYKLLIDASSRQGQGLCGVLSRILQAATPSDFGFASVTLLTPADDSTDWPDVPWLHIRHAAEHGTDDVLGFDTIRQQLTDEPETVLLSLNTVRFPHERSALILSDAASSTLSHDKGTGGFLQKLKEKIIARSQLPETDGAAGIIAMSCYAIAQTARLGKMQHLIPRRL